MGLLLNQSMQGILGCHGTDKGKRERGVTQQEPLTPLSPLSPMIIKLIPKVHSQIPYLIHPHPSPPPPPPSHHHHQSSSSYYYCCC